MVEGESHERLGGAVLQVVGIEIGEVGADEEADIDRLRRGGDLLPSQLDELMDQRDGLMPGGGAHGRDRFVAPGAAFFAPDLVAARFLAGLVTAVSSARATGTASASDHWSATSTPSDTMPTSR